MTYAFLNEDSKKEIRRAILKAISIPGYLVPFASREMPVARGWGTGGIQITLSIIKEDDIFKIIDQGCDGSVNAVTLRNFIKSTTIVKTTFETDKSTLIQSRHRIPEIPLKENQILVLQVPYPDVLVNVEPDYGKRKVMHAYRDYSKLWVLLYEDIVKYSISRFASRYPVVVNDYYIMDPSPIPKFDIPKLNKNRGLILFGAGREKMIYAVPPYTKVEPLVFEDLGFEVETFNNVSCHRCGATGVFMDEIVNEIGEKKYYCNDTSYCDLILNRESEE